MIEKILDLANTARRIVGNIFKPALFIISVIAILALFFSLPLFLIAEIEITGNSRLSEEYIKERMQIRDGETIIFWNAYAARQRLLENNYVGRVDISIDYLSREVTVNIRERILSGYVEYVDGLFLYIDEYGRVLETSTSFIERLPVVIGLDFTEFTIGEVLRVNNQSSFDLVVTLAQLLNKYPMSGDVKRIDVSKPDDIHIYVQNIDVELGDISDAEEKIRTVQAIIKEELSSFDARGNLIIRDVSKPPRFVPLR